MRGALLPALPLLALPLIGAIAIGLPGCSADTPSASMPALELAVKPGKGVFRPGEPIPMTIVLTNASGREVTINQRIDFPRPEMSLEITHESGKRLTWMPPIPPAPLEKRDFDSLDSDESLATTIGDISRLLSSQPRSGKYTVKAIYRNDACGDKFGVDAWTGELASHVSEFEIRG